MILPIILLQKPLATSKAKDHSDALLRRIDWFNDGNIERLVAECRDIQYRLRLRKRQADISRIFSKLMMERKIHAALRFLSEKLQNEVYQLSENVLKSLQEKHPAPAKYNKILFFMVQFII